MKQHITIDQLNELSDKGKEKLREWWIPRAQQGEAAFYRGSRVTIIGPHIRSLKNEEFFPLLSIGQMIEFLNERELLHGDEYGHLKFSIRIYDDYGDSKLGDSILCDFLWEAVREELENDEKH